MEWEWEEPFLHIDQMEWLPEPTILLDRVGNRELLGNLKPFGFGEPSSISTSHLMDHTPEVEACGDPSEDRQPSREGNVQVSVAGAPSQQQTRASVATSQPTTISGAQPVMACQPRQITVSLPQQAVIPQPTTTSASETEPVTVSQPATIS